MKYYSTSNPCPICQSKKSDCRYNDDGLIFCHTFIDEDAQTPGYKWIKATKDLNWGIYVSDTDTDRTASFEEEREKREYLAKKGRENQQKRLAHLKQDGLPIAERSQLIKLLAQEMPLKENHRADLTRRGLSDKDIERGLFFSIDPNEKIGLELPLNFPGAGRSGDRIVARDSGYTCIAFDSNEQPIGWQVKSDHSDRGKYLWAKGEFSSHLPNGELPLTVIKNVAKRQILEERTTVYLCEGILKPFVASCSLHINVIGAAGGNFSGSPEQMHEAMRPYREIVLVVDAGDVINPHVLKRIENQINWLKRYNRPVSVLWWGQASKSDLDVDEINKYTFRKARRLTPFEFFDQAREISQDAIAKEESFKDWTSFKSVKSNILCEEQFISGKPSESGQILAVKSSLGTGKTHYLLKDLANWKGKVFSIGYRNSLLVQTNAKAREAGLSFYHLQDDKDLEEFNKDRPDLAVSLCIDSLLHFQPEHFEGSYLVLDEVESVFRHLIFGKTIKKEVYPLIESRFVELLKTCDRIICLDACLSQTTIDAIASLSGKKITVIENTYKGNKADAFLSKGSISFRGKRKSNDRSFLEHDLLYSEKPIAIATDSQKQCEALEKALNSVGKEGIRIDSTTTHQDKVYNFLHNPDDWIKENRPDYVVYSPSAESGLDISTKGYFDAHYCFFYGVVSLNAAIQMVGRVRDPGARKVIWSNKKMFIEEERGNARDAKADRAWRIIEEYRLALGEGKEDAVTDLLRSLESDAKLNQLTALHDSYLSAHEYERKNRTECLTWALREQGYKVEEVTDSCSLEHEETARQLKSIKEDIKVENASNVYLASDKYVGKTEPVLGFRVSPEDRWAIEKSRLEKRLPGIISSEIFTKEFIKTVKYDKPTLLEEIRLWYLLNNPEVAKAAAQIKQYGQLKSKTTRLPSWKQNTEFLKINAISECNFLAFIERFKTGDKFTADTPEVAELIKQIRLNRKALGIKSISSYPIQNVNRMIRSVGLTVKTKQIKVKGYPTPYYWIDPLSFADPVRKEVCDRIELAYTPVIVKAAGLDFDALKQELKAEVAERSVRLESIKDVASDLPTIECAEGLAEYRAIVPREILREAYQSLDSAIKKRITEFCRVLASKEECPI